MSAEDLGMRELGQVRSQRLDELLTTLRLLHDPSSNSKIGIPALDKLLATHTTRFDPTNFSTVPAPPMIEVTSPAPKSGKTDFLYRNIANLVLGGDGYGEVEEVEVGDGMRTSEHTRDDMQHTEEHLRLDASLAAHRDVATHQTTDQSDQSHNDSSPRPNLLNRHSRPTPKAIALLSTSSVNVPRLSQILLQHLLTKIPSLPLAEAQTLVHAALSHIHVYETYSLPSLIATLSSLPSYFLSPTNTSKERRLGGIFVDTPSEYFWEDKVASTSTSTSASSTAGKFPALATTLKRVAITLQTPVFYSTSHFSSPLASSNTASSTSNPSNPAPAALSLPPTLPPPFATLPTLRLIIYKAPIQGFSKETDAETAVRQKEARDTAVREAAFKVQENRWGREGHGHGQGQGMERGFEVSIDGEGVSVV